MRSFLAKSKIVSQKNKALLSALIFTIVLISGFIYVDLMLTESSKSYLMMPIIIAVIFSSLAELIKNNKLHFISLLSFLYIFTDLLY